MLVCRRSTLKVSERVLLQFFLVLFNNSKAWRLNTSMPLYAAIQWVLVRTVMAPKGYNAYIAVFYILAITSLGSLVISVWIAVIKQAENQTSKWLRRYIKMGL